MWGKGGSPNPLLVQAANLSYWLPMSTLVPSQTKTLATKLELSSWSIHSVFIFVCFLLHGHQQLMRSNQINAIQNHIIFPENFSFPNDKRVSPVVCLGSPPRNLNCDDFRSDSYICQLVQGLVLSRYILAPAPSLRQSDRFCAVI